MEKDSLSNFNSKPTVLKKIQAWGGKELLLSAFIFLLAIFAGAFIARFANIDADRVFGELQEILGKEIMQVFLKEDFLAIFFVIFRRNITVAAVMFILGALYKYLPILVIAFNGLLLGIVIVASLKLSLSPATVALLIAPHGIFEILAFIIASATAIRLSRIAVNQGFWGKLKTLFQSKVELLIIVVLLLIASFIETSLIFFI